MFRLLWAVSVRTRDVLRYAPTNILLAAIRTRRGLKFCVPAMLLAVPYFLAASWCVTAIEQGGSGSLNLLVLLFGYNALKFIINGPISLALLVRVRIQEPSRADVRAADAKRWSRSSTQRWKSHSKT